MGMLAPLAALTWIRTPFGRLPQLGARLVDYWRPPSMALVQAHTHVGRLDHPHGPLALFLTVAFVNPSPQPIRVRSLAVYYGGTWYQPLRYPADHVDLVGHDHRFSLAYPAHQAIRSAAELPPACAVERVALYRLPESWEQWPLQLKVSVKATFSGCRPTTLSALLTPHHDAPC